MKLNSSLVLVKVDPVKKKDEAGFYISEEWEEVPPTGVVQNTASDVTFCKKGDRVLFSRYTATQYPNKEDLRIVTEDNVLAVLNAKD